MNRQPENKPILGQLSPAVEITTKNYSLQPDMMSGWRPNCKIVGPIPLNFDNPVVDSIVEELISFGSKHKERVIYLGLRPASTYKMHDEIQHQYNYKHTHLFSGVYTQLNAFFRKFYSNFSSKTTRMFKGMNPTIEIDQLKFDSGFEGGNLDVAIKVGPNEYDLFMRIDSNTIGHLQWFNFRVFTIKKRRVKFNICNFKKNKTLYQRGMSPYLQSSAKGNQWIQGGLNVKFQKTQMRYEFLEETYSSQKYTYNCLSFQYQFQDEEQVGFAYSPPHTYSEVLKMNKRLLDTRKTVVKQGILGQSLSGLPIPLLTITNFQCSQRKKCVIVSGRVHPGEANSSHCLNGLIEFICSDSEQARELRDKIVFKIIPMINPDGVVIGNFRTSLAGKDLNRVFKTNQDILYPEVKALKNLVNKLKHQFGSRLQLFLDFHGHSVKKNVFIYGPQYALGDNNYYRTRMLPKLISTRTQMFRYYSCLFRIAYFKRTTARAVILRQVPHCYTIEASNSCYYSSIEKKNVDFKVTGWQQMGRQIGLGLFDHMQHIQEEEQLLKQRRKKLKDTKNKKKLKRPSSQQQRIKGNLRQKMRLPSVNSIIDSPLRTHVELQSRVLPDKTRELIQQIKKDQQNYCKQQSDQFSEGGSDSQSGDDMSNQMLNNLHQKMVNYLDEFQSKFSKRKVRSTKLKRQDQEEQREVKQIKVRQKPKPIQLIPSLRKRAQMNMMQAKRLSINKGDLLNGTQIPQLNYNSHKGSGQRIFSKSLTKTHMSSDISNLFVKCKQINFDRQLAL